MGFLFFITFSFIHTFINFHGVVTGMFLIFSFIVIDLLFICKSIFMKGVSMFLLYSGEKKVVVEGGSFMLLNNTMGQMERPSNRDLGGRQRQRLSRPGRGEENKTIERQIGVLCHVDFGLTDVDI